nr:hypothetical protein [Tanacetum cinerariifolium]
MDKSWMRTSKYAAHNLQKMRNIDPRGNKQQLMMPCSCTTCLNYIEHKVEGVQFHLFKYKIDLSYTKWDKHGEKDEQAKTTQIPVNATIEFVDDTNFDMDFGLEIPTDFPVTVEVVNATKEILMRMILPIKLLNLNGNYGASDKFFTELLGLLIKMLLVGNEMVEKTYQAIKLMRMMGPGYKKIHVCSNNFIIYWKDNKVLTVCPTCGISRWKVGNKTHKVYKNIPAKVMWYFPIIPRLQRLFKLETILEDLKMHATRRITNGVLRHPADSHAWRTIDEKFVKIAKDLRNLRLGISADGVDVNSGTRQHSVWPVLSVIYNLPPWLCMKKKFIMLSVLISRYPGNDIDVFLEPLVDDLGTLFETGVDTYDASTKENFNLHDVVLWMINDYPALGTLYGCPYSGFKVGRELAISKDSVSKTVRWISYGPCATIVKYDAYNINGYTFRMKSNDAIVYQNSEVSVEAVDLHISKEVATTRKAFYYGFYNRYGHRDTINAAAGGTFMKRRPKECYDLIKNMTGHHSDWDTSAQQSESSSSITSSSDPKIIALKAEMAEINKNLIKVLQINHQVKAVTPSGETCGGPHSYNDCPATVGQTQNVYAAGAYQGGNSYQPQ